MKEQYNGLEKDHARVLRKRKPSCEHEKKKFNIRAPTFCMKRMHARV